MLQLNTIHLQKPSQIHHLNEKSPTTIQSSSFHHPYYSKKNKHTVNHKEWMVHLFINNT